MTAIDKNRQLRDTIRARFPWCQVDLEAAETLRRAAMTLHRWSELEGGNSNHYASWCITRDEATGKPFMETRYHRGPSELRPIPDREAGALRRIEAVCRRYGLSYFHQTDPRGPSLYIGQEYLDYMNYDKGIAI